MAHTSSTDVYNTIKREIKTLILKSLSRKKLHGTANDTDTENKSAHVFVEIGTGHSAEWTFLIRNDWKEITAKKQGLNPLRTLPDRWISQPWKPWHGYLVEAHPGNFSSLVETTVANKHLRPFLHRLTFINAAIGAETASFSSMGMETGALKALFVNRFSLGEAQSFQRCRINNAINFRLFTVSLETLFAEIPHKHIDLLRLDVEGAEVPILGTYSFQMKPQLLSVEHHSNGGASFIRQLLQAQNYRIDAQNAEEIRGIHEIQTKP